MIENEEFALEFTKWLLNGRKVTKCTSPDNCEEYRPKEYDLLLGEIIQNGDKLINEFWQYKYEECNERQKAKRDLFNGVISVELMNKIENPFKLNDI